MSKVNRSRKVDRVVGAREEVLGGAADPVPPQGMGSSTATTCGGGRCGAWLASCIAAAPARAPTTAQLPATRPPTVVVANPSHSG